jgi:glycosyltransferase involved in cell wall biosynthesis
MGGFACEPGRGSEPGVGFTFARALAQLASQDNLAATLLTRPHTAPAIRAALTDDGLDDHLAVHELPVPLRIYKVAPKSRPELAYALWQAAAAKLVGRQPEGTIYHHVTFASANLPSAAAVLARRMPVVFGPAGTARVEPLRGLKQGVAITSTRSNLRLAAVTIAQSEPVSEEWRRITGRRASHIEPNAVVDTNDVAPLRGRGSGDAHIVSVGLLIQRKRHDLVIRALAQPALSGMRLKIVGDGPLHAQLVNLARDLGVLDRVQFLGWVDHATALREIAEACCLALLSDSEGAGWAVAEAQALGTPVVVRAETGGAQLVAAAKQGRILPAAVDAAGVASAIRELIQLPCEPVDRWSADRLPGMLRRWYTEALSADRP